MLFDLETKTGRLYKSRIIKDIYESSNGSTLKLRITYSDLKHNRKIVEPGCHVYHQDTEYTITSALLRQPITSTYKCRRYINESL